ncbi:hypothetical protein ACFFRR_009503 [Megaselia abdita]
MSDYSFWGFVRSRTVSDRNGKDPKRLQGVLCFIFLDILIFARIQPELLSRHKLVEDAFLKNNLTINKAKTVRNTQETEFLGFTIKNGSISPTKTEAIGNFQIPRTVKELRSFVILIFAGT